MKTSTPKKLLLPASAAVLFALSLSSALAGGTVQLSEDDGKAEQKTRKASNADSPSWHRKIWSGSFDAAADASGAAARQLENLDYGDCKDYWNDKSLEDAAAKKLYYACMQRKQQAPELAAQARSVQKQQKAISLASKASDVAALGTVGATIYSEMGVKNNNQSNTYEKAARIEKTAGQVTYAAGAADLVMGAYAFVAHKNKLEQIKSEVTGSKNGVKSDADRAANGALTNAVEAAKKAAYNHMMWGAGKLAAGYGMMYLAKKSEQQAERMASIEEAKELSLMQQIQAQQASQLAPPAAPVVAASGAAPYYQNNNPVFSIPNASGASGLATSTGPVSYTIPGGGAVTNGSTTLSAANAKALAAATGKTGGGGGLSGGGDSSGGSARAPASEEEAAAASNGKEKTAKEAMGSSFEMQLTGGVRNGGGASSGAATPEVPNIAALMGNGAPDLGSATAATGISPAQIFSQSQEGIDGSEQGSMAGVNGKSEISLFEITKAKLTKMFQIGNVGIPKNVEVKN